MPLPAPREPIRRKVRSVRGGTESLETTVPEEMTKELQIEQGDFLEWEPSKDAKGPYAKVRRVRMKASYEY